VGLCFVSGKVRVGSCVLGSFYVTDAAKKFSALVFIFGLSVVVVYRWVERAVAIKGISGGKRFSALWF